MKKFILLSLLTFIFSCAEELNEEPNNESEVLDFYNVYNMKNATDCPNIPGTFFLKEGSECTAFFPTMGDFVLLQENPSFRYSVPIKINQGKPSFSTIPEWSERCQNHPKIQYILTRYTSFHATVDAGKAEIDLKNANEISADGSVCRLKLNTEEQVLAMQANAFQRASPILQNY